MPAVNYTPFPEGTRIVHRRQTDDGVAELWHFPTPVGQRFSKILRRHDTIVAKYDFHFAPDEPVIVPLGYHRGQTCYYEMETSDA